MEDVERLLKGTVEELDRLLNAKNVLGAPIERDGSTVIPMVSYGFAFGAGGGSDQKAGQGGGSGGGGGIRPIGAIVFDEAGARVEGVHGSGTSIVEAIGEAAAKVMDRAPRKNADDASDDKAE